MNARILVAAIGDTPHDLQRRALAEPVRPGVDLVDPDHGGCQLGATAEDPAHGSVARGAADHAAGRADDLAQGSLKGGYR